jgi:hypothetical protein
MIMFLRQENLCFSFYLVEETFFLSVRPQKFLHKTKNFASAL